MPREAHALAAAVAQLGIPVYLSGMARGLLGRDHPLQMRHQRRNALREADCVLLAGVPCDFRLDYGKHVRRSATLIAANRSAKDARLNRKPDIAAIGDAGLFIAGAGAGAARQRHGQARLAGWIAHAARARRRARGRDRRSRPQAAGEHVNPIALLPRAGSTRPATTPCSSPTAATSWPPPRYMLHPRAPLDLAGPRRLRHAGRGRGLCARRRAGATGQRGLDHLGRRRLRLRPGRSSTPSCATASR